MGRITTAANKALKALVDAAEHLHPDDTAEAVLARGGVAADAWTGRADLDDAAARFDSAISVAGYLGSLPGLLPERPTWRQRHLFVADAGCEVAPQPAAHRRLRRHAVAW